MTFLQHIVLCCRQDLWRKARGPPRHEPPGLGAAVLFPARVFRDPLQSRETSRGPPLKTMSLVLSWSVGFKCGGRDHIPSKQISHIPSLVAWTVTWIPTWRGISEPPEGPFKITYLLAHIVKCNLNCWISTQEWLCRCNQLGREA